MSCLAFVHRNLPAHAELFKDTTFQIIIIIFRLVFLVGPQLSSVEKDDAFTVCQQPYRSLHHAKPAVFFLRVWQTNQLSGSVAVGRCRHFLFQAKVVIWLHNLGIFDIVRTTNHMIRQIRVFTEYFTVWWLVLSPERHILYLILNCDWNYYCKNDDRMV